MEKRTLIAIALSFLVIFLWSKFVYQPGPLPSNLTAQAVSNETRAIPADTELTKAMFPESGINGKLADYDLSGITFSVSEPIGAVEKLSFSKYQNYAYELFNGFVIADKNLTLKNQSAVTNGFAYTYESNSYRVIRTITYAKSNYNMNLEVRIVNLSGARISVDLPIILGQFDLDQKSGAEPKFQDMMVNQNGKAIYPNFKKAAIINDVKFMGMRDRYFCAIIQPLSTGYSTFVDKVSDKQFNTGLIAKGLILEPKTELVQKFDLYVGPQDTEMIGKINSAWSSIVYFGKFDLVAQVILGLLKFLFSIVKNWGVAIVLLSIAIYLILFPLTVAQMKSMKEMQLLQPKMEKLRKTYANDAKKMNEETMKLYKEHKVNPLGGCLPMILQIPIFITLYQVLSRSISLKGADFLWIKDLSLPDRLFKFPGAVPFIGEYFNILPILMAIGMFVQQKMSSVSSSGVSAEQQKMMMILFPLMFGVMFYNVPSGLVLYWFLNSTLMLIYQIRIMKSK